MAFGDIAGFGSMLASFMDTAVGSSDRKAANELNYWAQMDTNKTNANINVEQLAAARENWKREQQNFELQRKWALEDRDFENSYNSPINVRNRLLQAGINPALAMNGQGGVASVPGSSTKPTQAPSFGSPPSSIPMQAAHFDPVYNGGLGLAAQKAIDLYLMAQKNESDIAATRQRVDNETRETMARIRNLDKSSEYNRWLANKVEQDWMFNNDTYSERVANVQLGNEKARADIEYQKAINHYQDMVNQFTPQQQKLISREYDARYKEIMSAANKNDSESVLALARKAVEEANKKGADISNEMQENMADAIVGKAFAEEDRAWFESGSAAKRYYGGEAGYRLPIHGYTDNDLYNRRVGIESRRHHKGSHYNYFRPE